MHAAQECGTWERRGLGGLKGRWGGANGWSQCRRRLTGRPLISSRCQNISQLEIFGDMSTPPDITSPSVSALTPPYAFPPPPLILPSNNLFFPLLFSLRLTFNARRPPRLPPTPWTPRRACSRPLSCLLPSILLLCPQVGPCCFYLFFLFFFHSINVPRLLAKRRIK